MSTEKKFIKQLFSENEEFYPTPADLIEKMLGDVDLLKVKRVLEPSAGKGDIIDALLRKRKDQIDAHLRGITHNTFWDSYEKPVEIECIEKDANLRYMLEGKGFRVIHDDFLTFRSFAEYDLCIMNPPFSEGDKHLMKAMDVMKNGGTVICVLNAETLRNPYTTLRKRLVEKLQSYNADIQYVSEAFEYAERKTDVGIAIVKVQIPEPEYSSFIFDDLQKASTYAEDDYGCTDIVGGDFIEQILRQYDVEIEMGVRLIHEYRALQPHILADFAYEKDDSRKKYTLNLTCGKHDNLTVNSYIRMVRSKYWAALFHNEKFVGKLTSSLQDELQSRISKMEDYDFTLFNIRTIQDQIRAMIVQGVEDEIINLFDMLSAKYTWYEECTNNVHYYNGWATNKAHVINSKVIIPTYIGFYAKNDYRGCAFNSYQLQKELADIEKALSYLDKGDIDIQTDCRIGDVIESASRNGITKKIKMKYFTIDLFKKGTCHITFSDPKLLERFNIFGSRKKGWLPPCYGKKKYSDMTDEEKQVVTEFQGEDAYERVCAEPSNYIIEPQNNMPLLSEAG